MPLTREEHGQNQVLFINCIVLMECIVVNFDPERLIFKEVFYETSKYSYVILEEKYETICKGNKISSGK